MDSDSRTLLLAFGGMNLRIGMPPFEFLSQTGDIPVKRLFVRDFNQSWYHRGMPGYGDSLISVSESLREMLADHELDRLVVAGASAGGYAALVFGTLLGADTVLCFSPQTILDLDVLDRMGDHRWDEQLKPLIAHHALDRSWVDLRSALALAHNGHTRYRVYFDDSAAADRAHAERLLRVPETRLYRFGRGDHMLVRNLRDSGALARILQSALHSAPEEPGGGLRPVRQQIS
jgi:acetyl esterase/lipase